MLNEARWRQGRRAATGQELLPFSFDLHVLSAPPRLASIFVVGDQTLILVKNNEVRKQIAPFTQSLTSSSLLHQRIVNDLREAPPGIVYRKTCGQASKPRSVKANTCLDR